jgi:hypothetical protein
MQLKKNFLFNIFFVLFTVAVWCRNQTLKTPHDQFFFLCFCFFIYLAGLILKWKNKTLHSQYSLWLNLLNTTLIFSIVFQCWNMFFTYYSSIADFKGNIFRGAFTHLRAPMYGHLYDQVSTFNIPVYTSTALFLGLFAYLFYKNSFDFKIVHWIALFGILLTGFLWNISFYTSFLSNYCHYETFSIDKDAFNSIKDLFQNFSERSSQLNVHNNHYPPGILMLIKLESYKFPFILKPIVLICSVFSVVPLLKLLRLLNFQREQIFYSILLFITSGAVLFFPKIDPSAIVLPLVISGVYYLIRFVRDKRLIYAVMFGISISAYLFFSFMAIFYGLFCIVFLLVLLLNKKTSFRQILILGSTSTIVIVLFYFVIFRITEFDLLACFQNSLKNEHLQMTTEFFNGTRYLLVSSGNLISYLGILGVPALLSLITFRNLKSEDDYFFKSIWITIIAIILFLSFSNQFYLETERIWIIFTPFVFIITGSLFNKKNLPGTFPNVFLITLLSVITSLYLVQKIDFCY